MCLFWGGEERPRASRLQYPDWSRIRGLCRACRERRRERAAFLRASLQDLATLLRESDRAGRPRRALYLLAHEVTNKLSQMMDPGPLRRLVSSYAASSTTMIGGPTHGLDYRGDRARVWREFPETGRRGAGVPGTGAQGVGHIDTGCPANPDQSRR